MADNTHRTNRNYAVGQTVLLGVFAAIFLFDTGQHLLPDAFRAVGAALCGIGLVLLLSAFVSLRSAIQIAPEPKPGSRLVTGGVYKALRHPIYTAIVILVVGLFLRKPTVFVAIASAIVIAFLVVKARFEEQLLAARYPEYGEYRARTWGILPRL